MSSALKISFFLFFFSLPGKPTRRVGSAIARSVMHVRSAFYLFARVTQASRGWIPMAPFQRIPPATRVFSSGRLPSRLVLWFDACFAYGRRNRVFRLCAARSSQGIWDSLFSRCHLVLRGYYTSPRRIVILNLCLCEKKKKRKASCADVFTKVL